MAIVRYLNPTALGPLLLVLPCLAGCGGERVYEVSGTVTLNEQPLEHGQILLSDAAGTAATAYGEITDGRYRLQTPAGTKQVRITALQETGRTKAEGMGMLVPETVELIPPRYNTQTELTIEVAAEGPQEFHFDLQR